MYRSCIFCSAPLGSNEAIERFPVGRSLAFDAAKGRLWAVCPKCARWNLAPIEERWEAIEDAERLFRDTRLRAQSENVGLAKLRDGTRLIRVGQALPGELAVWRYGESLVRRRRRFLLRTAPLPLAGAGLVIAGLAGGMAMYAVCLVGENVRLTAVEAIHRRAVALQVSSRDGAQLRLRHGHLAQARLGREGDEILLHLPPLPPENRVLRTSPQPLVLRGGEAWTAMGRAMVHLNASAGSRDAVRQAVERLHLAGSPAELLLAAGGRGLLLDGARAPTPTRRDRAFWEKVFDNSEELRRRAEARKPDWPLALALEMALHEETERRALQGELAMLQAMWRQAEEIASIADRLPDLPAPDPPRLNGAG
jgi:hypothetical protein